MDITRKTLTGKVALAAALALAAAAPGARAQFGLDESATTTLADAEGATATGTGISTGDDPIGGPLEDIREQFRALYATADEIVGRDESGFERQSLFYLPRMGWTPNFSIYEEALRQASTLADAVFTATEAEGLAARGRGPAAASARLRLGFLLEFRKLVEATDVSKERKKFLHIWPTKYDTPVYPSGDPVTPSFPPAFDVQTLGLDVVEDYLDEAEKIRDEMLALGFPVDGSDEGGARLDIHFDWDKEPEVADFYRQVADLQWAIVSARSAWEVALADKDPADLPPAMAAIDRRGQRITRWAENTSFEWRESYFMPLRNRRETILMPRRGLWPGDGELEAGPDLIAEVPEPTAPEVPPVAPPPVSTASPDETPRPEVAAPPEPPPPPGTGTGDGTIAGTGDGRGTGTGDGRVAGEPLTYDEVTELIALARASGNNAEKDRTLIDSATRFADRLTAEGAARLAGAVHSNRNEDAIVKILVSSQAHRYTPAEVISIARHAGSTTGKDDALKIYVKKNPGPHSADEAVNLTNFAERNAAEDELALALMAANMGRWSSAEATRVGRAANTSRGKDAALLLFARTRAGDLTAEEAASLTAAAEANASENTMVEILLTGQSQRFTPAQAIAIARQAGSDRGLDAGLKIYVGERPGPHSGADAASLTAAARSHGVEDELGLALAVANTRTWTPAEAMQVARATGSTRGRDAVLFAYAKDRAGDISAADAATMTAAAHYSANEDQLAADFIAANSARFSVDEVIRIARNAGNYSGRDAALLSYTRARAATLTAAQATQLAAAAQSSANKDEIVRLVRAELLQ